MAPDSAAPEPVQKTPMPPGCFACGGEPDLCDCGGEGSGPVQLHTLTYEPDPQYPHLVRAHCSCGWHTSGWVTRRLAESVFGARHLSDAGQTTTPDTATPEPVQNQAVCAYCQTAPAIGPYDRCGACRTYRDEEWAAAHDVEHGSADSFLAWCERTQTDGRSAFDITDDEWEQIKREGGDREQTVGRFRIRLNYGGCGQGGAEFMVSVYDPALTANEAAFEQGEDHYCVYGPTSLDAIQAAVESVHSGSAERHFGPVRQAFGVPDGT